MKVIRISVDEAPKHCEHCPLTRPHTRDCGEIKRDNCNGGVSFGKVPDNRCKLTEVKK